uniref:Lipid-binding serum glycoprotein C-terminal domain-containing protein n=1 Tax=Pristionchus pacificus TaxID=54126 RepID=A0A8R1U2X5_PRIPA
MNGESSRENQTKRGNSFTGNPGLRIRLTKKGINQLKNVGVKLLNEKISHLSGYSTDYPFSQPGLEGHVYLKDVRVLRFTPAQISVVNFLPPKFIVFGLENMAISLAANFHGTAQHNLFKVDGNVEGTINGLTIALTSELQTTREGNLIVKVPNCSTIINHSHFNLRPEGLLGPVVKIFEGHINDVVRQRIPIMFCSKLQQLIEKNSPRLFEKLSKTTFEDKFDSSTISETEMMQKFIADLIHGLYMDNSHIHSPIVTYDYFETQQRGEIRYDTDYIPTPFYPKFMNVPVASDRMLYLFGSDYLFNSMLFHAYERNKLTLMLDNSNVPPLYRRALDTSCGGAPSSDLLAGICVGTLLPSIATTFPNSTTSFLLVPHTMPDFSFNGESAAVGLETRILSYVHSSGRRHQMMVASAEGQADVLLHVDQERMWGEIKLNKLGVHLHRASVAGIDPESVEQLSPLAKTFIGPQLSSKLQKGMPFPLKGQVKLLDPRLRIDEGYVELATDFILNEDVLREKINEAFSKLEF